MAEAELATIARPYARAAFSYALEQGLDSWSTSLQMLAAAVQEPTMEQALDNPQVTGDVESELLLSLFSEDLPKQVQNFVALLAEYDRVSLLPEISDMFELLKANHEKTMEVEVVSAFEIQPDEQEALTTALHQKLKRNIAIESTIDKSLIGGVIIKAEDTVIDNSVRGKLEKLSNALV